MKKNVIVYGEFSGLYKRAIEVLTKVILDYTHVYPICVDSKEVKFEDDLRYFFIGTKENNEYLKKNIEKDLVDAEGYCIKVKDGNVYICGCDERGVLYGCIDFYNKYITEHEYVRIGDCFEVNVFEEDFKDFEVSSSPSVKNRGIWTWGHVIYDYKGFIENMMRLKMNEIIIWNDYVPINAKDIVDYAHSHGIKVIWGFSWLWTTNCAEIDIKNVNDRAGEIVEKFEKEYKDLNADGIYFQSFTELQYDVLDGVVIADAVTGFVNKTSQMLLEKYPNLELQFGLHATSVKERLEYIKNVNKNVRIVWEDCGAAPYHYLVTELDGFDETVDFTKKIASLRGKDDKFGVVLKSMTKLDWTRFEYMKGSQYLGVSSSEMQANRLQRKSRVWKYVQAQWIAHAPKVYEMVQVLNNEKAGDLDITVLVEDGMFEKKIFYPVALFAEMLWDCNSSAAELMSSVATRYYVDFE